MTAPALSPRLVRLIDDAAVFPPGNAPVGVALDAHLRRRPTGRGGAVGGFVVDDRRLGELLALVEPADHDGADRPLPLELVVVTDAATLADVVGAVAGVDGVALTAVELRPGDPVAAAHRAADVLLDHPRVRRWVELAPGDRAAVADVVAVGAGIKIRCGGADPSDVPAPAEVVALLAETHAVSGQAKLTAGLHAAVRSRQADGGDAPSAAAHGFVNLLLAAAALEVDDRPLAEQLAATERVDELRRAWGSAADDGGRILLRSFGSCSIDEPLDAALAAGFPLGAALATT